MTTSTSTYPTSISEYFEPQKEWFTKTDSNVYIIVKWLSPKRYQLHKTYIVGDDDGEKYLRPVKYQHHLIFSSSDPECKFDYKQHPTKLAYNYNDKTVKSLTTFPYQVFE